METDYVVLTYLIYLGIATALTWWVARVLFKNGRVFMLDIFRQDEKLTDAINKLLLVGFYLVNIGYAVLSLKIMGEIETGREMMEVLSRKIGFIILVLGFMHFGNMALLYKMRKRSKKREEEAAFESRLFTGS